MIPIRPGEKIKTDRRDARKLAELARAHLLTVVRPPTEDEEAVRDLCRGRDDARLDLMRARHRLTIRSGEDISQEGKTTYYLEYKLADDWSVIGEYDRFNALNAGLKWRIFSR